MDLITCAICEVYKTVLRQTPTGSVETGKSPQCLDIISRHSSQLRPVSGVRERGGGLTHTHTHTSRYRAEDGGLSLKAMSLPNLMIQPATDLDVLILSRVRRE